MMMPETTLKKATPKPSALLSNELMMSMKYQAYGQRKP